MGGFFMATNEIVNEHIRKIAEQPQNQDHAVVVLPLYNATLLEVQQQKGEIIRSSHLGNDYPSNQAFVNSTGACFGLYDRTTGVDKNYFPWQLILEGEHHDIAKEAPEDLLTPFFRPNALFFEHLGCLPPELHYVKTPAQLHYASQKVLHSGSHTFSEWILKNREAIALITNVIGRGYAVFDREMGSNGRVTRFTGSYPQSPGEKIIETAELLVEAVIEGNPQPREGVLLHTNELNLYLDAVIEALKPQNQRIINGELWGYVLHGAGPDMIRYATGLWKGLSGIHGVVLNRLPELGLPRKIVFGLIPTAELKLALPQSDIEILNQLAQSVLEKDYIKKAKRANSSDLDTQKIHE